METAAVRGANQPEVRRLAGAPVAVYRGGKPVVDETLALVGRLVRPIAAGRELTRVDGLAGRGRPRNAADRSRPDPRRRP